MARVLVTGGAGFIGSHLVSRLVARGDEVVVLDRLDEQVHGQRRPRLPQGVTLVTGDIGETHTAEQVVTGAEVIVHLAAAVGVGQSMYEVDNYVRRNTMATATLLEAVINSEHRPSRLVVASSMSIYGEGAYKCEAHGDFAPAPRSEDQLRARDWDVHCPKCGKYARPVPTNEARQIAPTSVYAITKRDQEELCLVVGAAYGIPTVALRFFNVYGPGQALSNPYTGVAAIFAARLMNGHAPNIFEDGAQSRDFVHVSDIVEGITRAMSSEDAVGHAINLGTGRPTTVSQVATTLAEGLGVSIRPERLEQFRAGDIRHCYGDTRRAAELLGFHAAVSFDEGMTDLLEWLKFQDADDRVELAMQELTRRGLTGG
jgi:dTDP-L-rhamnose 4-epimerase